MVVKLIKARTQSVTTKLHPKIITSFILWSLYSFLQFSVLSFENKALFKLCFLYEILIILTGFKLNALLPFLCSWTWEPPVYL